MFSDGLIDLRAFACFFLLGVCGFGFGFAVIGFGFFEFRFVSVFGMLFVLGLDSFPLRFAFWVCSFCFVVSVVRVCLWVVLGSLFCFMLFYMYAGWSGFDCVVCLGGCLLGWFRWFCLLMSAAWLALFDCVRMMVFACCVSD